MWTKIIEIKSCNKARVLKVRRRWERMIERISLIIDYIPLKYTFIMSLYDF